MFSLIPSWMVWTTFVSLLDVLIDMVEICIWICLSFVAFKR